MISLNDHWVDFYRFVTTHGIQGNTKTYEFPSGLDVCAQQKPLEFGVNHSGRIVIVCQSNAPAYSEHDSAESPPYKESIGHEQDAKSTEKPTSQVPVSIKVPDSNIANRRALHERICDKYLIPAAIVYSLIAAGVGGYFMVMAAEAYNS